VTVESAALPEPQESEQLRLSLLDGPALGPILGRVVWMVAATRNTAIDRLDDILLVTDAISMRLPAHLDGDRLSVTIDANSSGMQLRAGPLTVGSCERLLADDHLPAIGSVIDRIASATDVEVSEGAEYLTLALGF
jgi:hypothetical protein